MLVSATAVFTALAVQAAMAQTKTNPAKLAQFDDDRDGNITRSEFDAFYQKRFDKIDANADGVIGHQEARDASVGPAFIRRYDVDDDAGVSFDEYTAEPASVFDNADSNANGIVDQDELEEAKKIFVQSRKTN